MTWKLEQPKQCATCPWKKDATVANIPDYDPDQHLSLQGTIADLEASFNSSDCNTLKIMACHYSTLEHDLHCIGWLYNQLTGGNNIALRLEVSSCENIRDMRLDGEQKDAFEDTFR
jgi:hypothetical protein